MRAWTPADAERYLLSLELFGMRFGLDRMRRLMTAFGNPQRRFQSIHVVGTNGKSSTTRMIAALLGRLGVATGAYTSPHLVGFAERIQVAGRDVTPDRFAAAVGRVRLSPPTIPLVSNVTGGFLRPEEATDPAYWARQLRGAVRFADGLAQLLAEPQRILLEVGPGDTLASFAREHPARLPEQAVIPSLRHPRSAEADETVEKVVEALRERAER